MKMIVDPLALQASSKETIHHSHRVEIRRGG